MKQASHPWNGSWDVTSTLAGVTSTLALTNCLGLGPSSSSTTGLLSFSNKPCSIDNRLVSSTPLKLLTLILFPVWQPNGMTQSFLFCLELDTNGMLSIIGTKCIHCLQFQSMEQLEYLTKRQKVVEAPQEQNQCWEFSIVGLLGISLALLTFPWTCSSPFQHLDKGYALIPHSFTEFY